MTSTSAAPASAARPARTPPSAIVAIASMVSLALLAAIWLVMGVVDVAVNGIWSESGVWASLHLPGRGLSLLIRPLLLLIWLDALRRLLRRDPRVRLPLIALGLTTGVVLGILCVVLVAAIWTRDGRPPLDLLGLLLAAIAPFAALAASLSRPSAKAWLAPASAGG